MVVFWPSDRLPWRCVSWAMDGHGFFTSYQSTDKKPWDFLMWRKGLWHQPIDQWMGQRGFLAGNGNRRWLDWILRCSTGLLIIGLPFSSQMTWPLKGTPILKIIFQTLGMDFSTLTPLGKPMAGWLPWSWLADCKLEIRKVSLDTGVGTPANMHPHLLWLWKIKLHRPQVIAYEICIHIWQWFNTLQMCI